MAKSEYGKGLVICLVKFAEHIEHFNASKMRIYKKWMDETPKNRKLMISGSPPDTLNYGFPYMQYLKMFVEIADKVYDGDYEKYLAKEIEMMMNAASDHLYDIEVPKGKEWDAIRRDVRKLQSIGLKMGHGFTDTKWTIEDFYKLFALTRKIALKVDRKIGLKPDEGKC